MLRCFAKSASAMRGAERSPGRVNFPGGDGDGSSTLGPMMVPTPWLNRREGRCTVSRPLILLLWMGQGAGPSQG